MTIRVRFIAGDAGDLLVERVAAIAGESLPRARAMTRVEGSDFVPTHGAAFTLDGVRSNERYVERIERTQLVARQEDLGRSTSDRAALIPIRKSAAWWALPQDERRAIFEARSHLKDPLKLVACRNS